MTNPMTPSMSSSCARCGAPFGCAMAAGDSAPCWCMSLPPMVAVPAGDSAAAAAGCWCRACLEQHIAQSAAAAPV